MDGDPPLELPASASSVEHSAPPSASSKRAPKLAQPAGTRASRHASSSKNKVEGDPGTPGSCSSSSRHRSGFTKPTISSNAASLQRRNSTGEAPEKKTPAAAVKRLEPVSPVDGKKASRSNSDSSRATTSKDSPSEVKQPSASVRKPAFPVFGAKKASSSQPKCSNASNLASGDSSASSPSGLSRSRSVTSSSKSGPLPSSSNKGSSLSSRKTASTAESRKGSSLSSRKTASTAESRDYRFMMLPQVDVKAGDDLRLDMRGHRVRKLTSLNLSSNLEFVYLRDNLLSSVEGIQKLKRVKVLDLSFNDLKNPGIGPLENCKALQQLYLAGNQITSIAGLPQLPYLEFLSVAQNKLKSLSMPNQPRLQVLASCKNKISTLKGFPHLPALEHLRLEENPLVEMPHLEAASILLVGPTLKKFNDRDLSREELELAKLYPPHAAFCIRNGWELCSSELAEESTFRFLADQWKDQLPPGYVVKEALVDNPYEEDVCRCHFNFGNQSGNSELTLKFQWLIGDTTPTNFVAIPDAVGEVYWPKHGDIGKCLKVECTPFIGVREYPSIFAVSLPVNPGTGCPKVVNMSVEGELIEGNVIEGVFEIAWCGGSPGKGIAGWLRRRWNSSPVVIVGAEDVIYRLTADDIDSSLVFMYTPVTAGGDRGDAQYATTNFVKAAAPSVNNVRIEGEAVEGNMIQGVGEYFGGKEGPSKFEWLREVKETSDVVLSSGSAEYTLTKEDVGHCLKFVYVPINFEGQEGKSVSVMTDVVKQVRPKVANLKIIGDLLEGNKATVTASVTGCTEGSSRVQWFKTCCSKIESESSLEAINASKTSKTFRIPLYAVGFFLVAKFTPMTVDGEVGESAYAISKRVVEALLPSLNFLSVTGKYCEGELLTASYEYIGGHEGKSQYDWYLHETESDPGFLIPEASGNRHYRLTKDSVGKYVSFKCTPIRDDGNVGEPKITFGPERVCPGSPRLLSLKILGKACEGTTLTAEKKYWGGQEGDSVFHWFLTAADGTKKIEVEGAIGTSYTPSHDDIGFFVSVSCEPFRSDWAHGPVILSDHVGPILPGSPTCTSLELIGLLTEGERLSFIATYSGGERGNCTHEWYRVKNGLKENLSCEEFLNLTVDDIGGCIGLIYTPIRKDGLKGYPKTIVSDIIAPAKPEGLELALADCCEDVEIVPFKSYFGGKEGVSKYIWHRTRRKMEYLELQNMSEESEDIIIVGENLTYTPSLEDVGSYLSLFWLPMRDDGVVGEPLIASSNNPVMAALPSVSDVCIKEGNFGVYCGGGKYYGGYEGLSLYNWYRETSDGSKVLIDGANSITYEVKDSDYCSHLLFGYTPIRSDDVAGQLGISEPSHIIFPEIPVVEKLFFNGEEVEGEILTAVEVIPKTEIQRNVWSKYIKEVKYQWFISVEDQMDQSFEPLPAQQSCSYRIRFEDIERCLRCECTVTDVFGRLSKNVLVTTGPIVPGVPKIDKLEIEGRGFHTNLYAIRGVYTGGREGKSRIQWLRSTVGSPDLISIPGEIGRMYEANVDDVGYQLVVVYTPVRKDGVEGKPVSASTDLIAVEPDILKEVKHKLDLGSVKFEVLCEKDRSAKKLPGVVNLERRILEVNKKRVKVVKPGSKTSFPATEIRGTYAPPFHVELCRNDQHRLKIVVDGENEADLMVQTRYQRDAIVLVIRGLAQRFNSTSLNSLLQIGT